MKSFGIPLALCGLVTSAMATSALASGYATPAPTPPVMVAAPAPVLSWSGFYAGGQIAAASGNVTVGGAPYSNLNSTAFGLFAGYNHQLPSNWVIGAEVGVLRGTVNLPTGVPNAYTGTTIDLRLRGGYAMGRALLYGFVGGSRTTLSGAAFTPSGWTAGLGIDYMATERLMLGVDVAYRRLQDSTVPMVATTTAIELRAAYRF